MNREKRKRRLQVKCQLERLETRWLMRANPILAVPVQPLETVRDHPQARAQVLALRLSAEIEQRLSHENLAASPLDLKDQKAEIRQFGTGDTMSWGTLRVLARLEADGDNQFDLLYQQISTRFDHWAARHPVQARRSGVTAAPLQPVANLGEDETQSGAIHSAAGPGASSPPIGFAPDGGPPPPIIPLDTEGLFVNCNCPPTANELLAAAAAAAGLAGAGIAGAAAAGAGAIPPSTKTVMDSDATLIAGDFLQSHQLATYQSLGELNGIDLQYSSLDADPNPIVTAFLTTQSGSNSSSLTSITASLTVNGTSQGSAVTYNDISLTDGQTYIVQIQAVNVSTYTTGMYSDTLSITKNFSAGSPKNESYNGTLMVVNDASSPYGAGWSIAGLQQIFGTAGSTLMITDGSNEPELFTTSNGTTYTGDAADLSSLVYSSSLHTYTRTYTDGTVVKFDSAGQETSIADQNGNTTNYTYVASGAAAGALYTITDPVGLITTLAYNATTGKLSTVTDPVPRVTTFAFSGSKLASITDPDGAITSYGYNSSDLMTTEINPDNQTATVTYDSFTRMSSETLLGGLGSVSIAPAQEVGLVAAGGTTALRYPANFVGSVTDADNAVIALTFDQNSGVIREADGLDNVTTITLNSHELPTSIEDPLGNTTTYQYDSSGNPTTITQADGTNEVILYNDNFGIPTHIVDFDGNATTFTLDAHGNVTQETDPDGQSENFTYNSAGQMLTSEDALGKTTTYTYNNLGRLTSITEPGTSIATIQYAYDSAGDVTQVTDEVGDTITYTYDAMGRTLSSQDPVQALAGKDVSFSYDKAGNLISVTDALGNITTYSYNARNELISVKDPLSNITTYGYDDEGNNTTVEDARGYTTTFAYDADNDLVSTTDPMHNVTTYVYDADNEVINMIDPNGGVTTYTYNNLGEESTMILPGQTAPTTFTYDEDGNELSVTDQLGDKTVYTYNDMNWMATETVYPNGTTPETTTYRYSSFAATKRLAVGELRLAA
jgi:YD repeat-containing protein